MKYSDKLIKRLEEEFDIKIISGVIRTYVGYWQKTDGAWSWYFDAEFKGTKMCVGSQWPVKECARANRLVVNREDWWHDWDLVPED